ncbi:MAG: ABC transporter ATP-binding protein [Candidatus Thorarchaeota archaeon]
MSSIIRTEDISKTFSSKGGQSVEALRNITLSIEEGKVTAIGGVSGSGKSTLLSVIGLLTKPSKGHLYIGEEEVSGFSEVYRTRIRRDRIGFIFQAQYLLPQMTSIENVALPTICTDTTRQAAEEKAETLLTKLSMEHRLDFRIAELSGGEQQRVSIARALINNPSILIADEPSSSIDDALTEDLLSILRLMTEKEGLTVIVASHDKRVLEWADNNYILRDGELVAG